MEEHLAHRKSPSRHAIENKIVQDEMRLKELQSSLQKSEQLTGGMVRVAKSSLSFTTHGSLSFTRFSHGSLSFTRFSHGSLSFTRFSHGSLSFTRLSHGSLSFTRFSQIVLSVSPGSQK